MKYCLLDDMLEEILVSHGILKKNNLYVITEKIREEVQKIPQTSTVGIYGVGLDADTLLLYLEENEIPIEIDNCFDRTVIQYSYKGIIKNEDVVPIEKLNDYPMDYMIIGSYDYKEELKATLQGMGYNGIILDFFEMLKEYLDEYTADYRSIYDTRVLFEKTEAQFERKMYLEQLIKKYLIIKDFESAFSYMDKYIELGFDENSNYGSLKAELQSLLDDIKEKIASRTTRDIVVHWLDAIPYEHIDMLPYVSRERNEGISFENAYTVNPWTTEVLKCIMYGKYSIGDRLFLKNEFILGDTQLLNVLEDAGYTLAYIGLNKYIKLFTNQTICFPELNYSKDYSSIPRYWNMIKLLYEHEGKLFILVHTLRETHEPYVCGEVEKYNHFDCAEINWKNEEYVRQAVISSKYIDGRRHFYDDMLNKNCIKIFMSDHGRITNSIIRESRVHILFIICDKGQIPKKIGEMFSLIDFWKIIKMCIDGNYDFEKVYRDYVVTEALDYYNGALIKMALNDKRHNIDEAYQRRAIITLNDRYCRFARGDERYYVGNNDRDDCSMMEEYQDRISELRTLCGDNFIDINKYKKFEASKKLYED